MVTERGPTARRGRQFSHEELPDLVTALNEATMTLRSIQSATRVASTSRLVPGEPAQMDRSELERLARETRDLLTDLRAELRRRGHF